MGGGGCGDRWGEHVGGRRLWGEEPAVERPVAVIPVGEEAEDKALEIAHRLRLAGLKTEQGYSGNLKKRMIRANKANARKAVIIGSEELARNEVTVKDLDSGEQKNVALDQLIEEVKQMDFADNLANLVNRYADISSIL